MKIALVNGSPKAKNSASGCALRALKKLFDQEHEIFEYNFRTPQLDNEKIEEIVNCSVIVVAFPLYVDGIPSHLLNNLYEMESYLKANPKESIKVYPLLNCGFFEGDQCSLAVDMVENWCNKAGVSFGQGVGIGGGGMLPMLSSIPEGKGPLKGVWEVLKGFANNISTCSSGENIFTSPNFPRFAYKFAAEAGWRQQIKSNGLRTKDLFLRK